MDSVVERAKKKYKKDSEYWAPIYEEAKNDLYFLSDDKYAQWDQSEYDRRESTNRPILTIDQTTQFVHQVANKLRINTPSINIVPSDDDADVETAEVFKGIIRNIEYRSKADSAYDLAGTFSVKCSIGYVRVDHSYTDLSETEQELVINRVVNPLSVFPDCRTEKIDGSDMKHCTILECISKEEFEELYPGKEPVSFEADEVNENEDEVKLAEFFESEVIKEVITDSITGEPVESKRVVINRYRLSGVDKLEETVFPGVYVPIIPMYGEEHWMDGKRRLFSLIRKAKSAQRQLNLHKSLDLELLMKQPLAPVMAAEGQTEPYRDEWADPNSVMVLRYKTTDVYGNPLPPPQRLTPPQSSPGFSMSARQAVDDLKATMGIYNASLGIQSNERSGVAITQRKEEGDVATYHFVDNQLKAIEHVGRVCVSAIPEVYVNAKRVNIIDAEDNMMRVGINGALSENQLRTIDLKKGKYDVKVVTGASYTTKRQEAAQFFQTTLQTQPDLMKIMGDLLFENMDFSGAQAMASRMKKVIDPKLLSDNAEDPEKEALKTNVEQAKQIVTALQTQIADLQKKLDDKSTEIAIKAESARMGNETDRMKITVQLEQLALERDKFAGDLKIAMRELELKEEELGLKRVETIDNLLDESESPDMLAEEAAFIERT